MLDAIINNNSIRRAGSSGLIKTATVSEKNRAIGVVTMGFSTDPLARWTYPDSQQYLTHFPKFIRSFAGKAFESGSAYTIEGFAGAALWLPPNVHPDEDAVVRLFEETVSDRIKDNLFQLLEQMGAYHPQEPHWYLPMIAVDTFAQNRGYGSALMRHALAVCDRVGLAAYLDSTNPRNISLYLRFGFEILGTIQVGSSPPIFPMLRKPQRVGF
jgi:ribosomal protein S18 acetylase RimI-like enzyme